MEAIKHAIAEIGEAMAELAEKANAVNEEQEDETEETEPEIIYVTRQTESYALIGGISAGGPPLINGITLVTTESVLPYEVILGKNFGYFILS